VRALIACSVGCGSEKSVFDARSVNASAAPSLLMSRSSFWKQLRSQPFGAHRRRGGTKAEERRSMSSEQNKTIVRRLLEEPWKGNLQVVDELILATEVGHNRAFPSPLAR